MRHHLPRRAALAAVSLQALLLCGPAMGQSVQMFDEAPSLAQLRSIMVPESHGGPSRRIVLPHVDGVATSSSLQPAAFAMPAPAAPITLATPAAPAPQPMPAPAAEAEAPIPEPRQATPVAFRPAHPAAPRPHRVAPAAASGSDDAAPAEAVGFRINFAFNSDVIPAPYGVFLDRVAALMKEEAQVRIQIEGHTDATGPDAYNLDLSQRRAAAAAEYLVRQQGIEPDRLVVAGKGKSEPLLADPYNPRNRRVQFVRVD